MTDNIPVEVFGEEGGPSSLRSLTWIWLSPAIGSLVVVAVAGFVALFKAFAPV